MDLTPSQINGATFRTVRKGYDPAEVDALLNEAAAALEQAQQQATAMEARARAAVARLQEQQQASAAEAAPATPEPEVARSQVQMGADEAETISRTLLLAQRTADTAIAEAEEAAEHIRSAARTEADATLDSTREMSAQLIEQARAEARKANEAERLAAANEVESLKARREFLLGDVDQIESFLIDQRERLRGAARQIEALCDRVPSGLAQVAPPLVSASDDEPGDETGELFLPPETRLPFAGPDELADALGETEVTETDLAETDLAETGSPNGDVDTRDIDVTQAIDPDDVPTLPIRGQADDETPRSN